MTAELATLPCIEPALLTSVCRTAPTAHDPACERWWSAQSRRWAPDVHCRRRWTTGLWTWRAESCSTAR
jgi:hypothetical protein